MEQIMANSLLDRETKAEPDQNNTNLAGLKKSRNKFSLGKSSIFFSFVRGLSTVLHSRFLTKRPRPFTFSHMVTSKCNCNCSFCFWKHHADNEDLTLPEIQRIYKEAKKEGYMNSILWGGEPLLRQDFTEIAKASHDNGMYTKMATNGWFLEENHEFGKYMDLIFVSIDAIGEKHDIARGNMKGLYDRCISGIEFHKKHYPKMRIYVCCTVSKANNVEDLTEIAKLLQRPGYSFILHRK
ncbi:MAG: radical SAM protein [Desulfosudis oleivorans]|nr:radical SAM protein [Desulfosudis oleivorans]